MASTHTEWLQEKKKGIGGSEAAAILGMNPYMNNVELWEYKTGRKQRADISGKDYVQYGLKAEAPLRKLFALDYPKYEVKFKRYDLRVHPEHDFIVGTLDGELTDKASGKRGVLEIKTTNILQSMHQEKWNNRIPQNYFVQCLHYLLVTCYDFVVLKAQLKTVYKDGDVRINTRNYFINREDVQTDIDLIKEKVIKFWNENVLKDVRPNLVLPAI